MQCIYTFYINELHVFLSDDDQTILRMYCKKHIYCLYHVSPFVLLRTCFTLFSSNLCKTFYSIEICQNDHATEILSFHEKKLKKRKVFNYLCTEIDIFRSCDALPAFEIINLSFKFCDNNRSACKEQLPDSVSLVDYMYPPSTTLRLLDISNIKTQ